MAGSNPPGSANLDGLDLAAVDEPVELRVRILNDLPPRVLESGGADPMGPFMESATLLFPLGQIVATRHALDAISHEEIWPALARHQQGDWGALSKEDLWANDEALATGGRLLSPYRSVSDVHFWIITEHDRSVTTILLPEDY